MPRYRRATPAAWSRTGVRTRAGERIAPRMRSQHFLEKALALLVCTALVPERAFANECDPHAGQRCTGAAPGLTVPCPFF